MTHFPPHCLFPGIDLFSCFDFVAFFIIFFVKNMLKTISACDTVVRTIHLLPQKPLNLLSYMRALGVSISNKFTNLVSYKFTILHLKRQIGSVPCTCKNHLEKSNRWRTDRDFIIPPRNLLQNGKSSKPCRTRFLCIYHAQQFNGVKLLQPPGRRPPRFPRGRVDTLHAHLAR